MTHADDPFSSFKEAQRQAWGRFAPIETFTMMPAADLVRFARVNPGEQHLDVATGTGVVAITTARNGAKVTALDLSPPLLERARINASWAGVEITFQEGDVERLPFADAAFDVVTSQFGHMFAPRPEVAISEMLRVLKPGGRIAFSSWPPEHFVGQMFQLTARHVPPPDGVASPVQWGEPKVIAERLGNRVRDLLFDRGVLRFPALSPRHYREFIEPTLGPVAKLVEEAKQDPAKLHRFREEFDQQVARYFEGNYVRQDYLMTRAVKK